MGSKVACRLCGRDLRVPTQPPAKTLLGELVPDSPAPPSPAPSAPQELNDAGQQKTSLACPACRRTFRVKQKYLGRQANCPACGAWILLSPASVAQAPFVELTPAPPQAIPVPTGVAASSAPPIVIVLKALRFGSATTSLLAVILFCLPWVNLRCSLDAGSESLAKQSGLQSIYGGCSLHPYLERSKMLAEVEASFEDAPMQQFVAGLPRNGGGQRAAQFINRWGERPNRKDRWGARDLFQVHAAPWMVLYPLLLMAAAGAGFWIWNASQRLGIVGCCCGAAFLLIIIQAAAGFPLENQWNAALRETAGPEWWTAQFGLLGNASFTSWFWLALVLTGLAPALVACERWLGRSQASLLLPTSMDSSRAPTAALAQAVSVMPPQPAASPVLPSSPVPPGLTPIGDCPACQKPVLVPHQAVGRWINCPHCGHGFAALPDSALSPLATSERPWPARLLPITPAGLGCVVLILACLGVSIFVAITVWKRAAASGVECRFGDGEIFSARLPLLPQREPASRFEFMRDRNAAVTLNTLRLTLSEPPIKYVICHASGLPKEIARDLMQAHADNHEQLVALLAAGLTRGQRGALESDDVFRGHDRWLRESVMKQPGALLRARLHIVDTRLCLLGVIGSRETIHLAAADVFFDSFQVVRAKK